MLMTESRATAAGNPLCAGLLFFAADFSRRTRACHPDHRRVARQRSQPPAAGNPARLRARQRLSPLIRRAPSTHAYLFNTGSGFTASFGAPACMVISVIEAMIVVADDADDIHDAALAELVERRLVDGIRTFLS